jgi:hypothetical protein
VTTFVFDLALKAAAAMVSQENPAKMAVVDFMMDQIQVRKSD